MGPGYMMGPGYGQGYMMGPGYGQGYMMGPGYDDGDNDGRHEGYRGDRLCWNQTGSARGQGYYARCPK